MVGREDDAVFSQVGKEGGGEVDEARFGGQRAEERVPGVEGGVEDLARGDGWEGEGLEGFAFVVEFAHGGCVENWAIE